jgi:hypothetical protein
MTIYSIRIYTKAGHQIDLDVEDFTLTPNKEWVAKWYKDVRIVHLDPSSIEAVIQLGYREVKEPVIRKILV